MSAGPPSRPTPNLFMNRPVKREVPRSIPAPARPRPVDNPDDWTEFPLVACTQKEIEETRLHILKFQSKKPVDPKTFHKPIRLHRKETKNLQYQLTRAEIEIRQQEYREQKRQAEEEVRKQMEEHEQAVRDGLKLARIDISKDPNVAPEPEKTEEEKRLEKMMKQQQNIAPDGGARRKINPQKRKTRKLQALDPETRRLRYEEYYPWVMEDYDGQNTWVGQYEAANADQYCLLYMKDNKFYMVPSDKVYKFTPRSQYATLTLDEAEARLKRHNTVPRWLMKHLDEEEQKLTRAERTKKKLKTVEGGDTKEPRGSDDDALDYDEEFADDEEAPIIEGNEEENKESEKRLKREMLSANAMGLHDDEPDDDNVDDLFEVRKVDKEGERLRKALIKTELNGIYDSDEEANPYLSESDLEADKSDEEIIPADLSKPVSPVNTSHPSRQGSPTIRSIKVKSIVDGFVVLKGQPSVLRKFPPGDWNPNLKKRVVEHSDTEDSRDAKRVKMEPEAESVVKIEENPVIPGSKNDDLTEEDIKQVIRREGKVTAKALISHLRHKINPETKPKLMALVKTLLKNENGFLVPRDPSAF